MGRVLTHAWAPFRTGGGAPVGGAGPVPTVCHFDPVGFRCHPSGGVTPRAEAGRLGARSGAAPPPPPCM